MPLAAVQSERSASAQMGSNPTAELSKIAADTGASIFFSQSRF